MKRLIILLIVAISLETTGTYAQTAPRPTSKSMTLCGVALGQEKRKFIEQLENSDKYAKLKTLLSDNGRIDDIHITTTYYETRKDTDIVYCAALSLDAKYNGFMGRPYILLKSILSSKFGNFETSYTDEGKHCLCWTLPYGQITMWKESSTKLVVMFVDYAALKKAYPILDEAF